MRRAVFLDRDGTLVTDHGYMSDPVKLSLFEGVAEGLRILNRQGFLLILVTNQSGISRGYFTEADLSRMHERLQEMLKSEGVMLDAIYYCPHHPDDDCPCRKPKTALIDRAIEALGIDRRLSFFVGDKESDVLAGLRAGLISVLVGNGSGMEYAHYVAPTFLDAARHIIGRIPLESLKESGNDGLRT